MLAAAVMDMIGVQHWGRDLTTGIVRGGGLGLAALFLYWDATYPRPPRPDHDPVRLIFTISSSIIGRRAERGAWHRGGAVPAVLLSSVSPDQPFVRGVPVRLVGTLCLVSIALAVALSRSRSGRFSAPHCWSGQRRRHCA